MKKTALTLAVAGFAAGFAATADARDLRLAPGAPPAHPAYDPMYLTLQENLPSETGDALTGTMLGTEVVNIGTMLASLQSQVAEVGNFLPLYYPATVPSSALAGDLAFLGTNPHAMGAAMTEYVVTCEDCLEEFKEAGLVFVGAGSSDVYVLMTDQPVETPQDMQGLRLRSGGSPFSRWAESMGAAPASVPVSDQFEQMSQGVINGTMASVNDLVSYRMVDLVKYVTEIPLGTYHATSNFTVALPTWQSLSAEERAGFMRAANKGNVAFTQDWGYDRPERARQEARDAGIEFIEPSQELIDATEKFTTEDLATVESMAADTYGIEGAGDKIARFQELVEKWTAIVDETGGDLDALAQRQQEEIWDKVDPEAYGL
ncbi:C4-dicarboxylate ABC transporter substrate-binding protein [Mesobaculum littorinae]|uniref:C4-dicarboxylate ABC transporter substrate-binding protein n=1 Tax=Mesobaculum littorinae TaxID=2486419 RepID=A0A438AHC0_9RHOB|nr:TRAP transporter substrate-binding protein DctP [Mesobaculum littorinae]RVV98121.1 C4-dicarboxylate ABC transporter substrate-binding protein [Mesobaculum littorinae]